MDCAKSGRGAVQKGWMRKLVGGSALPQCGCDQPTNAQQHRTGMLKGKGWQAAGGRRHGVAALSKQSGKQLTPPANQKE